MNDTIENQELTIEKTGSTGVKKDSGHANVVNIPMASIRIPANHRARNPNKIKALAESMREHGQFHPLLVHRERDEIWAATGAHRLKAAAEIGWTHINVVFIEGDELHLELITIDENLMRSELSPTERISALGRRKAIYLELHPDTRAGVAGGKARQGTASGAVSFADETAAETGLNKRTIQRDAARSEKLGQADLTLINGTSLDSLGEVDALIKLPRSKREEIIASAAKGDEVSAKDALKESSADKATELEKIGDNLIRAINKLCEESESGNYLGKVAHTMAANFFKAGRTAKLDVDQFARSYKVATAFAAGVVREMKAAAKAAKPGKAPPPKRSRRGRKNKAQHDAPAAPAS
jgi:ParB family chromosome partitioning protein